jgi:hypothetical protein
MEFLGFKKHTKKSFELAKQFSEYSSVIELDDDIVNNVISLKRKRNIKFPDAIIAATAIKNGWTLVTRNEKDFKNMDMDIYNPFSG